MHRHWPLLGNETLTETCNISFERYNLLLFRAKRGHEDIFCLVYAFLGIMTFIIRNYRFYLFQSNRFISSEFLDLMVTGSIALHFPHVFLQYFDANFLSQLPFFFISLHSFVDIFFCTSSHFLALVLAADVFFKVLDGVVCFSTPVFLLFFATLCFVLSFSLFQMYFLQNFPIQVEFFYLLL